MTGQVFVSYSHEDRTWRDAFHHLLGPTLDRAGLELWADDHIRRGERWERLLDSRMGNIEYGLILATPAHLDSRFAWEVEIPALLAAEVPLVWVLVENCLWEYVPLLRTIQSLQDPFRDLPLADHPRQDRELARLCRKLRDDIFSRKPEFARRAADPGLTGPRPLFPTHPGELRGPVPPQPPALASRVADLLRLRTELVTGQAALVGVADASPSAAIHGALGTGKTRLAAELARDPDTLRYFPDGVFWLSLGARADIVEAQRRLARWLGGDSDSIRTPLQGTEVLRILAHEKQCLIVLDDVQSLGVARALTITGQSGRLLLTTRDKLLLDRLGATSITLDTLSAAAARRLLGQITATAPSQLPPEADDIINATGRGAVAVSLAAEVVRNSNHDWVGVAARLAEGMDVFGDHPYGDAFRALDLATSALGAEEFGRYQALACLTTDIVIPRITLQRLWELAEPEVNAQLQHLADLSLVRLAKGGLYLHDFEQIYLLLRAEATKAAHNRLLDVHAPYPEGDWSHMDDYEPYLWNYLIYHLAAAGRHEELMSTVLDPAWLGARISRDGTFAAIRDLTEALRWEPANALLGAILRRLQMGTDLLDRSPTWAGVAVVLSDQLWSLRGQLNLSRLSDPIFDARPSHRRQLGSVGYHNVRTLLAHRDWVNSVAWSPDGIRLASGSDDRTIRVWDLATGAEVLSLSGHGETVWSVDWSPDGSRLASGGGDGEVLIWDVDRGTPVGRSTGHTAWVRSVAWSPDGRLLASGAGDGTVSLWDAGSISRLRVLRHTDDGVRCVAWSPDGSQLASGAGDGTIRVWDVQTGTERRALSGHRGWVSSVAWSPDGTRLASGAGDGTVRLWDVDSGAESRALTGHGGWIRSVAWAPDSSRLACSADDGRIRVWELGGGTAERVLSGHRGEASSVAWSSDGSRLVSCGADGTVRVWLDRVAIPRGVLEGTHTDSTYVSTLLARLRGATDTPEPKLRQQVAWALINRAVAFGQLGQLDDQIAAYDEVLARFGDAPEPDLREQVAWALINRAVALGQLGRLDDQIATYDEVLARFGDAPEPELREQVAWAIVNMAVLFGRIGRFEEEVATYDHVIARFADAYEPAIREQVATALVNRGITLGRLGRFDDALASYEEVLSRFGDASEPALRGQVAIAQLNWAATATQNTEVLAIEESASSAPPTEARVVITSASDDAAPVAALRQGLQRAGFQILVAPVEAAGAKGATAEWLLRTIRTHDALILVLSEAVLSSGWATEELVSALDRRLVDTIPVAVTNRDLPRLYADRLVIDLTSGIEACLPQLADRIKRGAALNLLNLTPQRLEALVKDLLVLEGYQVSSPGQLDGYDFCVSMPNPRNAAELTTYIVEVKAYRYGRASVDSLVRFADKLAQSAGTSAGLLATNSMMTSVARSAIDRICRQRNVSLRVVDGPQIKGMLLRHPDLTKKYLARDDLRTR